MMARWTGYLLVAGLLLAACGTAAGAVRKFTKGDELAYYDFSEPNTFEEGTYGDGAARLQIRDSVYHIVVTEGDSEVWYGQWGDTYSNVVVDVEAEQITEAENTVYGVMCRMRGRVGQPTSVETTPEAAEGTPEATEAAATSESPTQEATPEATADTTAATADATAETTPELRRAGDPTPEGTIEAPRGSELNINNGDGYLFLVEGTGRFAIMRARGRNVVPLVNWTTSDQINVGPGRNHLRAICVGNYLALYVNDQFMADTTDDTYTSGQVGLVASAANRLGLRVEFDDLSISEARTG